MKLKFAALALVATTVAATATDLSAEAGSHGVKVGVLHCHIAWRRGFHHRFVKGRAVHLQAFRRRP